MQLVEIEVKFRVANGDALQSQLRDLGFRCKTPRTFERNILFDTAARDLRNARQILRLRSYGGKWVITHKRTLAGDDRQARHKHRVETEAAVEDGAAIERVFAEIGYLPAFVYEKWRSEWSDAEGHCVIDETPIGLYAELEGPPAWIDTTLDRLHVRATDVTTLSYGRLFEVWQQETGSTAANMVFTEVAAAK